MCRLNHIKKKIRSLQNIGTSAVFHHLLIDYTSPKEIAEKLGIKPQSVIEQLRRLQKLMIVKVDRRDGKFLRYAIDTDRFVALFLSIAPIFLKKIALNRRNWNGMPQLKRIIPLLSVEDDATPKQCLKIMLRKLEEDQYFRSFLLAYLRMRFEQPKDQPKTLAKMMVEFEDGLKDGFPRDAWYERVREQEISTFLSLLEAWYLCVKESMTMPSSAVFLALREITVGQR